MLEHSGMPSPTYMVNNPRFSNSFAEGVYKMTIIEKDNLAHCICSHCGYDPLLSGANNVRIAFPSNSVLGRDIQKGYLMFAQNM